MTIYAAYSLMLLVPVVLPVAVIGLLRLFGARFAGEVAFALLAAVGVAGIPYLVMSIGLVFWARYRPAPAVRRAANFAPVILWLLVLVWWSTTIGLHRGQIWALLEPFGLISALVLGIGYLWVILAHGLVRWLRRRQLVVDAA